MNIKKVMFPTDFSSPSRDALATAVEVANLAGGADDRPCDRAASRHHPRDGARRGAMGRSTQSPWALRESRRAS